MTPRELLRRIEEAREFKHGVEGLPVVVLTVRLPEKLDMRSLIAASRSGSEINWDTAFRSLVPQCVVGWTGMSAGLLMDGLAPDLAVQPVDFDRDLVLPFFARRVEAFDALAADILNRYTKRQSSTEETLKN